MDIEEKNGRFERSAYSARSLFHANPAGFAPNGRAKYQAGQVNDIEETAD